MPPEPKQDTATLIRPSEAAQILGVATRTVFRFAEDGRLHPRKLPSGHRRYLRSEVLALADAGASDA